MPAFSFDPIASPEDNIERFLTHLETLDADMAALFRAHVDKLLPFPEGQDRTTRRIQFNKAIVTGLEALPPTESTP